MFTFQLLTVLPLLGIIEASYPLSSQGYYGNSAGTKRYGYGNVRRTVQWVPYRPLLRNQRSPMSYYATYPYNQLDNYYQYYPQQTYPVYYRTAKYDAYFPSYYYQKPDMSDSYDGYYYDIDPSELQEEMLQEVEREEREESQPIGHEMLYENEDYNTNNNNFDKTNSAYFQNLIRNKQNSYSDYNDDYENEWQDIPATKLPPSIYHQRDDKEVQDLRKLKTKSKNKSQRKFKNNEYKRTENDITSSVPKTQIKQKEIPKIQLTTSLPNTLDMGPIGQKEEVLMRPATPVRHPFNAPMMNMLSKNEERKRNPSVFDTLKRMLEMEKNLKSKYSEDDIRPAMKKRIISDEDSLIRQLTVLKKS